MPPEFLQIYLQVLNPLNLAYKKFDFTHYDLHSENVLIQELPYPISIPFYHPDGRTLYLRTNFLARIIDYGTAHVKIEGQHFGVFRAENRGQIFPDRSFPMHDAYKLLLLLTFAMPIFEKKTQSIPRNTDGLERTKSTPRHRQHHLQIL